MLRGDASAARLEGIEDVAERGVQLAAYPGELGAACVLGWHRVGDPTDQPVQVPGLDQRRTVLAGCPTLPPLLGQPGSGGHAAGAGGVVAALVVTHPDGAGGNDPGLGGLVAGQVAPRRVGPRAEVTLHHRVVQLGQRRRVGRVVDGIAAQLLAVPVGHLARRGRLDVEGAPAGPAVREPLLHHQ